MIILKTEKEIEIMKQAGKILAQTMGELEKMVRPGITTNELDKAAEGLVLKLGAGGCSFKGYLGYPNCLCASVNEVIVHGIPSDRQLKEGDILSLDLGVLYQGFHSDMAITVPIGKVSPILSKLIKTTRKSLDIAIKEAKPGKTFGDIGYSVEKYAKKNGFDVVRELCGHGIGRNLHEDPMIPNYGKKNTGEEIKEGMVFAIEPMLIMGDWRIRKAKDGYGFESADNSLSAHFEHTVAITKKGAEILTK